MAFSPELKAIIARFKRKSVNSQVRRDVECEILAEEIADEIYTFIAHDDVDFDVVALAEMLAERLQEMGFELPKPRISIRAATQHTA